MKASCSSFRFSSPGAAGGGDYQCPGKALQQCVELFDQRAHLVRIEIVSRTLAAQHHRHQWLREAGKALALRVGGTLNHSRG